MLVLSRKSDETIVIDGRITVKVVAVKGSRVQLAISAPRDVPIRRGELDPLMGGGGEVSRGSLAPAAA